MTSEAVQGQGRCGQGSPEKGYNRRVLGVLFISILSCMVGVGIIAPLLPVYATEMGATGIWLGLIFAGFSVSRAISMPLIGRWSDVFGRKRFIASGLLVYTLAALGFVHSSSPLSLALIRFCQGFAAAMVIPISMAFIGDITPVGKEGSYMGTFNTALFLGFGIGPLIGGFIKDAAGMDTAFYSMGTLSLAAFLLVLIYLPPSRRKKSSGGKEFPDFASILRHRNVLGLCCFRTSTAMARAIMISFLPVFASEKIGLSASQIGLIISANILLVALLQTPMGRFVDRLDRFKTVLYGSLPSMVLFYFLPLLSSFYSLMIFSLLFGLGSSAAIPAASAIAVVEGKEMGMGSVMAVFNVAMSAGLAIGPLAGGFLMDLQSLAAAFYLAATAGVLGTLGFFFISERRDLSERQKEVTE